MKKTLLTLFALLLALGTYAQDGLTLLEVMPESGSTYALHDDHATFRFDRAVSVAGAALVTADSEYAITGGFTQDAFYHYYYCPVAAQLKKLLNDGSLKAGDAFTVRLTGVCDADDASVIYGTDGVVEARYVAGGLPARLVSITPADGATLKSSYTAGDANARVVFTFDRDVTACKQVVCMSGNPEENTWLTQDMAFTIDGNSVVADLSSVKLTEADLLGSTSVTLAAGPVYTGDNEIVEGNTPGSLGLITVTYGIEEETGTPIYGGFDGGDIDGTQIEAWVSDTILFDAVRFDFSLHGQLTQIDLPVEAVTIENAAEDGFPGAIALTVPVSDFNFDAGSVSVALVNARDRQGKPVSITNEYTSKGRTASRTLCLSVSPTPGVISTQPEELEFVFNDAITLESASCEAGGEITDESAACAVDNNRLVLLIKRSTNLSSRFVFTLRLKDSKGEAVTYGETEGAVTAAYEIPVATMRVTAITPAEGTVESLKDFELIFANENDPQDFVGGFDPDKQAVLLDAQGQTVASAALDTDMENWQKVLVSLDKEITEPGTYTLLIPEATVFNSKLDDMADDKGLADGACFNPELRFTFTILVNGIGSATLTGGHTSVYTTSGVLLRQGPADSVLHGLPAGIYVAGGRKVLVK